MQVCRPRCKLQFFAQTRPSWVCEGGEAFLVAWSLITHLGPTNSPPTLTPTDFCACFSVRFPRLRPFPTTAEQTDRTIVTARLNSSQFPPRFGGLVGPAPLYYVRLPSSVPERACKSVKALSKPSAT